MMQPDDEGFLTPSVDLEHCTECGLCVKVCPWLSQASPAERVQPPDVFAAWHLDDAIRHHSSSGGVFSALAANILDQGGIVVGAAFDDNMVCRHIMVDTLDTLPKLRGSKYVQSDISIDLLHSIRAELKSGRKVLFSGTPCQVAGLRNFLAKDYENLFCCDLICMGVPSPGWFTRYIGTQARNGHLISSVSFRDKRSGWKRSVNVETWTDGKQRITTSMANIYRAAFQRQIALRESCYVCKFTTTERQGDLTIADFWKVDAKYPQYDTDDKGTSLVLVNTAKGREWLARCKETLFTGPADLEQAIAGNPMLQRPADRPATRDTFYPDAMHMPPRQLRRKYRLYPAPLWRKVLGRMKRQIHKVYSLRSTVCGLITP